MESQPFTRPVESLICTLGRWSTAIRREGERATKTPWEVFKARPGGAIYHVSPHPFRLSPPGLSQLRGGWERQLPYAPGAEVEIVWERTSESLPHRPQCEKHRCSWGRLPFLSVFLPAICNEAPYGMRSLGERKQTWPLPHGACVPV